MEKLLYSNVGLNTPLMEVGGGSQLDLVHVAVSPLDLHLDAFTVAVGKLRNTVSRSIQEPKLQIWVSEVQI